MPDLASIGTSIVTGLPGLAALITSLKGVGHEDRIKALEAKSKAAEDADKALRTDLDALAMVVRDGDRSVPASQTGQHPAIREPLSSVSDRELDGRVRELEKWRPTIDGWKEWVTREIARAGELAQEARDEVVKIAARIQAARDVRRGGDRESR